jgi:hypothetical protein
MPKRPPRTGSRNEIARNPAVPPNTSGAADGSQQSGPPRAEAAVTPQVPRTSTTLPSAEPEVIYRAGRQAVKVRFLMWFSLACAAGALVAARDLFLTYGTRPADGGVLASLAVRMAWSGTVAALGLGFAFGMWLYGCYAVREIWWLPAEHRLRIVTYRFVGSRTETVGAAEITGAQARRDRFRATDLLGNPAGISVDAPWIAVRLQGRRWPLVLDLQGLVTNSDRLRAVLHSKGGLGR